MTAQLTLEQIELQIKQLQDQKQQIKLLTINRLVAEAKQNSITLKELTDAFSPKSESIKFEYGVYEKPDGTRFEHKKRAAGRLSSQLKADLLISKLISKIYE